MVLNVCLGLEFHYMFNLLCSLTSLRQTCFSSGWGDLVSEQLSQVVYNYLRHLLCAGASPEILESLCQCLRSSSHATSTHLPSQLPLTQQQQLLLLSPHCKIAEHTFVCLACNSYCAFQVKFEFQSCLASISYTVCSHFSCRWFPSRFVSFDCWFCCLWNLLLSSAYFILILHLLYL